MHPVVHCISRNSCRASILLAELPLGVQYIPSFLASHIIPPGISPLVLPGYVQDTVEERDLLFLERYSLSIADILTMLTSSEVPLLCGKEAG